MTYPIFLRGPVYLFSRDAMLAILEISDYFTERFRLEDVYLFGIMGNQAGVRLLGLDKEIKLLWIHPADIFDVWNTFRTKFYAGHKIHIEAKDYSDQHRVIPDRWRHPNINMLKYRCSHQKQISLNISI